MPKVMRIEGERELLSCSALEGVPQRTSRWFLRDISISSSSQSDLLLDSCLQCKVECWGFVLNVMQSFTKFCETTGPRLRYPASWPPKTEQISRNLGQINSSSSVLGLRVNKESSCVNWLLLLLGRKAHKSLKDPVHARSEQTSSVWRWWETPTGPGSRI